MTFTVKMACDNASFHEDAPEYEIARILKHIAAKVEAGIMQGSAMDSNGNRVAQFKFSTR